MVRTEVPADRAMLKLLVRTIREVDNMDGLNRIMVLDTVIKLIEQHLDDMEEVNNG
jgi:hypothetical protein